jgi:thiol peroxidase
MTLVGDELKVGDNAPDFQLYGADLAPRSLNDLTKDGSRAALLILVPSIDTSVCSLETIKFNKHVASLPPEEIAAFTISYDLPFAQKRWSSSERVANLTLLSAYRDHDFGAKFGVHIKELGLLARSVFLIDKDGVVRYTLVMPEVAIEPDYDEVLKEARQLLGN